MAIDVNSVSKLFKDQVTSKVAEYIEIQTKAAAQAAGRRRKISRNRSGKRYVYRNTGQLASNIRKVKTGDGYTIDAGTRSNYTSGYHGMYFLVEKRGENDVKKILKGSKAYVDTLKL
ncbi:hypothetical protein [Brucella sp. CMUL 015]|uniref:hypothetical protein n=1 Tax=Brucella sp. CMUL 015 TaxID=1905697 RepID=UPI00094FDAB1|nr:hypothetical protein [Brucella sp. CMUL 015]